MTMRTCAALCNECPFSKKSMKGFLGGYVLTDFFAFQRDEVLFACHKQVEEGMTVEEMNRQVRANQLPLCRGYLESLAKSCKRPRDRELLDLVEWSKGSLHEKSMSIFEFLDHHTFPGGSR